MENGALKFVGDDNVAIKLLKYAIKSRSSLAITGTMGNGKTTLLKELVASVPASETIAVIQSLNEMRLKQEYPERNIMEFTSPEANTDEIVQAIRKSDVSVVVIGKVAHQELLRYLASMEGLAVLMFEYPTHTEQGLIDSMPKSLAEQGLVDTLVQGETLVSSAVHLSIHVTRSAEGKYFISHINEVMQKTTADSPTIVGRNVIAYMHTEGRHVTTGCLSHSLVQRIADMLSEADGREFEAFLDEQWGR